MRCAVLMLALALFGPPAVAQATSQPAAAGKIAGRVTSVPNGLLSETVVYLERVGGGTVAAPSAPVYVSQKGARFDPPVVLVCVGQTVVFLNDEERPVQHNVYSKSPTKPFDLGLYKPGVSRSVVFDKPGPVNLHCSIHRDMDGVVFVSPTPWFARVDAQGRFEITGVPAGDYELRTWQRRQRFPEASQRVQARTGATTEASVELRRN